MRNELLNVGLHSLLKLLNLHILILHVLIRWIIRLNSRQRNHRLARISTAYWGIARLLWHHLSIGHHRRLSTWWHLLNCHLLLLHELLLRWSHWLSRGHSIYLYRHLLRCSLRVTCTSLSILHLLRVLIRRYLVGSHGWC